MRGHVYVVGEATTAVVAGVVVVTVAERIEEMTDGIGNAGTTGMINPVLAHISLLGTMLDSTHDWLELW